MLKFISHLLKNSKKTPQSRFKGPFHLKGLVKNLSKEENKIFGKFNSRIQWRGKLQLDENESYFKIKFFGFINKDGHIVEKDNLPPILIIENSNSKNSIVIYDKNCHGYDGGIAQFYELNTKKNLLESRNPSQVLNLENETEFKIYFSVFYNHDYKNFIQNIEDEIQGDKLILPIGDEINLNQAFRNSFDFLNIVLESKSGKIYEVIHDELA